MGYAEAHCEIGETPHGGGCETEGALLMTRPLELEDGTYGWQCEASDDAPVTASIWCAEE